MNLSNLLLRKTAQDNKHPKLHEALIYLMKGKRRPALNLLHEAAFEGESNAYIILGYIFEHKFFSPKKHIIKYYLKAYELGNPVGLYHLGRFYYKNLDYGFGYEYLNQAYDSGVKQSETLLIKEDDYKFKDKLLFIVFGPLFFLSKRSYEAFFWFSLLNPFLFLCTFFLEISEIGFPLMYHFLISIYFQDAIFKS